MKKVSLLTLALALALAIGFGCGDDGGTADTGAPVDSATDTAPPTDGGTDADAGAGGTVTFDITANGVTDGDDPLAGATVWLRLPDGTLLEEVSNATGAVTFEGVDLDAGGLEVTVWKEGYVAFSLMGLDRSVIAFHEARGWSASAAEGRIRLNTGALLNVTLAGTIENGVGSNAFIQSLDAVSEQWFGFRSFPFEFHILSQPTTTLVAWDWSVQPAAFGERGRRWTSDATFLETPADADATGLVLDFAGEVPMTEHTISYLVPTGSPYFDEALPLAGLNAPNPQGGRGALVGFMRETVFDEATSTLTATIDSPTTLPTSEIGFIVLQLAHGSSNSNVVYPWEGSAPTAALEPDFLVPPSLGISTAAGITFGDTVAWSSEEDDVIQSVNYFTVPQSGGIWSIQAWGSARGNAAHPELPASVVAGFLPGDGELGGSVSLCDFTPSGCVRDVGVPFDVTR